MYHCDTFQKPHSRTRGAPMGPAEGDSTGTPLLAHRRCCCSAASIYLCSHLPTGHPGLFRRCFSPPTCAGHVGSRRLPDASGWGPRLSGAARQLNSQRSEKPAAGCSPDPEPEPAMPAVPAAAGGGRRAEPSRAPLRSLPGCTSDSRCCHRNGKDRRAARY